MERKKKKHLLANCLKMCPLSLSLRIILEMLEIIGISTDIQLIDHEPWAHVCLQFFFFFIMIFMTEEFRFFLFFSFFLLMFRTKKKKREGKHWTKNKLEWMNNEIVCMCWCGRFIVHVFHFFSVKVHVFIRFLEMLKWVRWNCFKWKSAQATFSKMKSNNGTIKITNENTLISLYCWIALNACTQNSWIKGIMY